MTPAAALDRILREFSRQGWTRELQFAQDLVTRLQGTNRPPNAARLAAQAPAAFLSANAIRRTDLADALERALQDTLVTEGAPSASVNVYGEYVASKTIHITNSGSFIGNVDSPRGQVRAEAPVAKHHARTDTNLKSSSPTAEDLAFMKQAIAISRRSDSEDGRIHPVVGAVVAQDGKVLAKAYRGEIPGNHAEYMALEKKLRDKTVSGATLYTTLEPCTTRNHPKVPCASRVIERKIARVFIGMLDPNPKISGKGFMKLRRAGIDVMMFPPELMAMVEDLNRFFIRNQENDAL